MKASLERHEQNAAGLRALIPCALAILIAAAPLFAQRGRFSTSDQAPITHQDIQLQAMQDRDGEVSAIRNLEREMAFLSKFHILDDSTAILDLGHTDPVNRLRSRIVDALQPNDIPQHVSIAMRQYSKMIHRNPAFNYGWPHFLLGKLFEKQVAIDDALRQYENVPLYNQSQLALATRFHIEQIQFAHKNKSVQTWPLYQYMRFAENSRASELNYFAAADFQDDSFAPYIHSLMHESQNEHELAKRYLEKHIQCHPNDPSAAYHLAKITERGSEPMHPSDGKLLASYWHGDAIRDGAIHLGNQENIVADFYLPNPSIPNLGVAIEAEPIQNTLIEIIATLNRNVISAQRIAPNQAAISFPIQTERVHNVLEIQIRDAETPSSAPSKIPLLRIMDMELFIRTDAQ